MSALAFDRDKSRCVRRNELGQPGFDSPRTLSELFADYAKDSVELYPLEVSNAGGYSYQSVITFAADNKRGACQVRYLCTLSARVAARRLGLRGWWDAYRHRRVKV